MKKIEYEPQREKDKLHSMMLFSQRFLDTDNVPDLQEITEFMRTLTGAFSAVFNQFEDDGMFFTTKAIAVKSQHLLKAIDILGFNPIGKRWPRDRDRQAQIQQETVILFDNLQSVTSKALPVHLTRLVENTFDIGQIAIVKTMKKDKAMGYFTLIMHKDTLIESQELAVLYATQVGLHLDRLTYEEDLRKQQQRLEGIIEGTHVGTWEWNVQTGETTFNDRWAEMVGYTLAELQPTSIDSWTALIHPEDSKATESQLQEVLSGKKEYYDADCRLKHRDGHWVWVHDRGKVISWTEDGKPLMTSGTHTDINDRKEYEQKLKESEEKHRRLFETMSAGIIYQDVNGSIISANPAAEKMLGITLDQMQGKTSIDPRWKMIQEDGTAVEGPEHPAMIALRTGKKTGPVKRGVYIPEMDDYVWLLITAIPLFRKGETKPFQVYALFDDITKRKQVEDALLESKEKLETLSNNIPNGMVYQLTVDPQGNRRFTYVSAGVEQLQGVTPAEVLNDPQILYDQFLEDDKQRLIETEERVFATLEPFLCEARIRKPDGEIRWVQFQSALSKKPDGTIVADGIEIDITDLKKAENKLQEYASLLELKNLELDVAAQEAQKANQAKSRYLAHMNHEIRTPLNGFMGFLQLMEDTQLDKEQQDFMNHMKQSSNHLLNIINNVLDMAKIEAGEMKLANRIFDLREEFQTALAPLRSLARQNNIHLQMTMDKNLPQQVKGDSDRLRQIILNLGGNAVKFTQEGQVHISIQCLETTHKHHTLQMLVEDTGPGMTQEILDKLFLPFYQADDGSTSQSNGSGLGMTITRELVELMDGHIQVESTPGKGTSIEVRLMLEKARNNDSQ